MWEKDSPVRLSSELHLTEYSLLDFWTNESVVRGDIVNMRLGEGRCNLLFLLRHYNNVTHTSSNKIISVYIVLQLETIVP